MGEPVLINRTLVLLKGIAQARWASLWKIEDLFRDC